MLNIQVGRICGCLIPLGMAEGARGTYRARSRKEQMGVEGAISPPPKTQGHSYRTVNFGLFTRLSNYALLERLAEIPRKMMSKIIHGKVLKSITPLPVMP